jgi:hypothetical protein
LSLFKLFKMRICHFKYVLSLLFLQQYFSFFISSGNSSLPINSFAFGSCYYKHAKERLDIFNAINKNSPELWLWLGDAAYLHGFTLLNYHKHTIEINFTQAAEMLNSVKNDKCKNNFNLSL